MYGHCNKCNNVLEQCACVRMPPLKRVTTDGSLESAIKIVNDMLAEGKAGYTFELKTYGDPDTNGVTSKHTITLVRT